MRTRLAAKPSRQQIVTTVAALAFLALAAAATAAVDGHHVDSGVLLRDFLFRVFNFTVTFGLLAYFLTKPIRKGLAGRREGIEKSLLQAQATRTDAEARFAEYDRKLSQAEAEIETIYADIRREGEVEREKILASAREMAEKIRLDAERTAASEVGRARSELRREAARLAVEIAEDLVRQKITPQDQERLVSEYMKKVGELH
ncbi:MAG: F0F1 ATP synthase subunit B [Desulfuromonadales bacterium]|nr:F0F1 ATP synthase subunit B [Desulfuromonadales bacterium]